MASLFYKSDEIQIPKSGYYTQNTIQTGKNKEKRHDFSQIDMTGTKTNLAFVCSHIT